MQILASESAYPDVDLESFSAIPDIDQAHEPVRPDSDPDQRGVYPVNPANVPANHPAQYPVHDPVSRTVDAPVICPASHQVNIAANMFYPEIWHPFSEKQGRVLIYLIHAGGRANREKIAEATGINIATVKYALRVFVNDGFISRTKLDVNHKMRGFSYSLNPYLCNEYITRICGPDYELEIQQDNHSAYYPVNRSLSKSVAKPVCYPDIEMKPPFSSSRKDLETSSSKTGGGIALDDPELSWWVTKGLTVAKTAEWLKKYEDVGLTPQDLTRSLKNAWYDAVIKKITPCGKPIASPMNWFYSFLPGGYPTPEHYRSLQQIQLDQEREELAELECQAEELATLRRKKRIAGLEVGFQQLLNDENSNEYQELISQIDNSFVLDSGGDLLDQALREKFYEQNGIILAG